MNQARSKSAYVTVSDGGGSKERHTRGHTDSRGPRDRRDHRGIPRKFTKIRIYWLMVRMATPDVARRSYLKKRNRPAITQLALGEANAEESGTSPNDCAINSLRWNETPTHSHTYTTTTNLHETVLICAVHGV